MRRHVRTRAGLPAGLNASSRKTSGRGCVIVGIDCPRYPASSAREGQSFRRLRAAAAAHADGHTTTADCDAGSNIPSCNTDRGVCVECVDDTACGGDTPYCSTETGRCVECLGDGNCGGGDPYCSPRNRCVECLTDANCSGGDTCELQDFSCGG